MTEELRDDIEVVLAALEYGHEDDEVQSAIDRLVDLLSMENGDNA